MRTNESQQLYKQMSHQQIRNIQRQEQHIETGSQKHHLFQEQYSFNRPISDISADQTYIQNSLEQCQSQLHRKYASIYSELKGIDTAEIVNLFLQQLEEHQRTRGRLATSERQSQSMIQEINELKVLVGKKRESIAQLCMTESDHLNLIQQLEGQINSKCFSTEGHFQKKYRQLETYMNEYIVSTNEVQEELIRNLKLLKAENAKLVAATEDLQNLNYNQNKQIELITSKVNRLNNICRLDKEKEKNLLLSTKNLEQQCSVLKKETEALQERLKATEQFKIELVEQNRELSSELDFIREKINESYSIRKDIFQKIEEHHQNSHKLTCQVEALQNEKTHLQKQADHLISLLDSANQEKAKVGKQNQLLKQNAEQVKTILEVARSELAQVNQSYSSLQTQNSRLRSELSSMAEQHETLRRAYEQERDSKEGIKQELIELASQVRLMQQTYHKELSQNQKIKIELQKFWEKRENPLADIANNPSLEHSPTFQAKSNRSKRSEWEKDSLEDKENRPAR